MPPLERTIFSPRFYADQDDQIICNHFSDGRLGRKSKALKDMWVDWCGPVKVKVAANDWKTVINADRCYMCDGRHAGADSRDHTPNQCPLFKENQTAGDPRDIF